MSGRRQAGIFMIAGGVLAFYVALLLTLVPYHGYTVSEAHALCTTSFLGVQAQFWTEQAHAVCSKVNLLEDLIGPMYTLAALLGAGGTGLAVLS